MNASVITRDLAQEPTERNAFVQTVRDTWLIFERSMLLTLRQPVWLLFGMMLPVMYLVFFGPRPSQMVPVDAGKVTQYVLTPNPATGVFEDAALGLTFRGRYAVVTLNDASSVSGNRAHFGGGIRSEGWRAAVTLNDSSSVIGNAAWDGGGILIDGSQDITVSVTLNRSSSVSGNTAEGSGGGISNAYGNVILHGSR